MDDYILLQEHGCIQCLTYGHQMPMYINSNDYFPLGFGAEFFQALPVVQQQCQALKANLFTGTQNIKPCFHALVTADKLFYHH